LIYKIGFGGFWEMVGSKGRILMRIFQELVDQFET